LQHYFRSAVADIELTWSETRQHRSEVVRELGKFVEDQIDLAQVCLKTTTVELV